ncbi:MAG: hypothetical protein RR235_10100, partial [Oscillospiraceae bacterium]
KGQSLFQVMPPGGGHLNIIPYAFTAGYVSSHAPGRGASPSRSIKKSMTVMFQVMPPGGGHQIDVELFLYLDSFKSCPREGGIGKNTQGWVNVVYIVPKIAVFYGKNVVCKMEIFTFYQN